MGMISLSLVAFMSGCGSSVSTSNDDTGTTSTSEIEDTTTNTAVPQVKEGIFVDAGVDGIQYNYENSELLTEEKNGKHGVFKYLEDQEVQFSLGKLILGKVIPNKSQGIVTPYTLVGVEAGTENAIVAKIASLLQSLDLDGDPTNGITITEEVVKVLDEQLADDITLAILDEDKIIEVVEVINTELRLELHFVSITEALEHLAQTMEDIDAGLVTPPSDEETETTTEETEVEDVYMPPIAPTTGTGSGTTGSSTRTS